MNSKRILVPLDLRRSTTDTLLYLREAAPETPFCATLLYVVELNVAAPNSLYQEICAESRAVLRKLSLLFFGHEDAASVRVRVGRADEEILAEARSSQSEIILLSGSKPPSWRHFFRSHTFERVLRAAPCPTLVLPPSWKISPAESSPQPRPEKAPAPSSAGMRPTWAGA